MAADRVPGDFGSKLRDARERRGILLRQIANATKISVAALEALERNDISKLPGGIFSRAFVRSYAVEVGLDPEQTIKEFIAQFPHDAMPGHPKAEQVEEHETLERDRRMTTTFLRLIALSIPIVGVVLYYGTVGRPASSPVELPPPPAAPAPAVPAAEPGAPAAMTYTPPAAPAQTAQKSPPPAPLSRPGEAQAVVVAGATAPSPDVLTVTIAAKRPCWVSAISDGQRVIDKLLQPGDRQTIEVRRELVITAGDGSAIALTLNGADARPLSKLGQVARVTLNLNNYKDYLVPR
jgi:cytoskeleton protein RodZ